jgi:hypothetical protein
MPVQTKVWVGNTDPFDANFARAMKRRQQEAMVLEFVSESFENLGWTYRPKGWSASVSHRARWFFRKEISNLRTLECSAYFPDEIDPRTKIICRLRLIEPRDLHEQRSHADWHLARQHKQKLAFDVGWGTWDLRQKIRAKDLELADPAFSEQITSYLSVAEKCWVEIFEDV